MIEEASLAHRICDVGALVYLVRPLTGKSHFEVKNTKRTSLKLRKLLQDGVIKGNHRYYFCSRKKYVKTNFRETIKEERKTGSRKRTIRNVSERIMGTFPNIFEHNDKWDAFYRNGSCFQMCFNSRNTL